MAKTKTDQFTTLNSIRLHLTRKTQVFAQILDIIGGLYIGLQRTSYQKNDHGVEEPRHKSIFLPFTARKNLTSNVSPTLVQQGEHLEQQRKTLHPNRRRVGLPLRNCGRRRTPIPIMVLSETINHDKIADDVTFLFVSYHTLSSDEHTHVC